MATNETYIPNRLYLIALSDLLPDLDQPRKYLDPAALTEMVDSIKEHGIIQPPTFRIDAGGLDITGLTHEERDSFANALDALKQIIESKFQAMAQ
jgi:hypothetical protein